MTQGTLDAIADAETLRLIAADHFASALACGEMYGKRYRDYHAYGCASIINLPGVVESMSLNAALDVLSIAAEQDAHSTFRAVPELRG